MSERPRHRDTRLRDRALFVTLALFVGLIAYAGHRYYASDAGRARAIVTEARARSAALALVPLGCRDPGVFAAAEVAQLVHLGLLQGIAPLEGVTLALCPTGTGTGTAPTCEAVGDAYVAAQGALPVHLVVLDGQQLRCSVLRLEPASHQLEGE